MLLYITARQGATTTQGETVASVRDSVCESVSDPQARATTFQGSCNLAELTKTRQEVKHLGCQLDGSRALVFRGGSGRDDCMPP